ncbi:hypothetical protein PsYK624_133180 [Phanerochaete sordida]|uniref:Uncharacterized protein n=1 Tax=Phanerochaete sordida TaxID=48140 RepID=A0A9P3LKC4_9APHY|nr:hypothetical protein PsYK624_133180 [Phanerochaete sordida]
MRNESESPPHIHLSISFVILDPCSAIRSPMTSRGSWTTGPLSATGESDASNDLNCRLRSYAVFHSSSYDCFTEGTSTSPKDQHCTYHVFVQHANIHVTDQGVRVGLVYMPSNCRICDVDTTSR